MKIRILVLLTFTMFNLFGQSADDLFDLGYDKLEQEKYVAANRYFTKVLELNAEHEYAYFNRGFSHLQLEEYESAIKDFDAAIKFGSDDAIKVRSYLNKAFIFRRITKEHDKALSDVIKAIEIDSMSWSGFHLKGLIFYDLKEYEKAISNFDKSIAINPLNASPFYDRGLTKRKLQLLNEAILDYDKAIKLDTNFVNAYNNRGFAKTILEDYQGAIDDFNESLKLEVNSYSYNNRGYAKLKIGDLKGAKKDCELAIKLDKTNSWAYHYLGLIYYELNDKEKACELFHQSLELGKKEVEKDILEKC